jgi:hypothetical protein
MSDFLDFFAPLAIAAVVLVGGIIGTLCLYEVTFGRWGCQDFSKITGLQTEWSLSLGCYVNDKGQWMSRDAFNQRNVQNRLQVEVK